MQMNKRAVVLAAVAESFANEFRKLVLSLGNFSRTKKSLGAFERKLRRRF